MNVIQEHEKWLAGKGGKRAEIIDQTIENGGDKVHDLSVSLKDANLTKAILRNVNASGLRLKNVNLEDAEVSGLCTFIPGEWQNVNLKGANLEKSQFFNYDFKNVDFSGANLKNVKFEVCSFINSKLNNANTQGACFEGAFFEGTDSICLNGADLTYAQSFLKTN